MSALALLILAAVGAALLVVSGWIGVWRLLPDARRGRAKRRAERKYRAKLAERPSCFGELMTGSVYGDRGCHDCVFQDACRAKTRATHGPKVQP